MERFFDTGDIKEHKCIIDKTWAEFREALANGYFEYNEIEKAKKCTFLKVYDDLFCQNSGIYHNTITVRELVDLKVGRGTILGKTEILDYERFIPKKEFIKSANRFSPLGTEWLYLTIGSEDDINLCAQAECGAKVGDRFGFCHFDFISDALDLKLVDLTIAKNISYEALDEWLEKYGQEQVRKGLESMKTLGFAHKLKVDVVEFKRLFTKWFVFTYTKLLSEQIFKPLSNIDDKSIMYAPFQTLACYYISLGYSGIIYSSTVFKTGRNLVLFDKNMAYPTGNIVDFILK